MQLKLDPDERELILKYGYPDPKVAEQFRRLRGQDRPRRVTFESVDLDMISGDLSRSMNHGQVPNGLLDAVDCLCSRLEAEM